MASISCPLCCEIKFEDTKSLAEHLSTVYKHLRCPICKIYFNNLMVMIEHLETGCTEIKDVPVLKMGKTNAEMCKNYYNRKKAAKEAEKIRQGLSVKKPRKSGAERARACRMRKKMLAHLNQSSKTEILSVPPTSSLQITNFETEFQLTTTSSDVSTVSSTGVADHEGSEVNNTLVKIENLADTMEEEESENHEDTTEEREYVEKKRYIKREKGELPYSCDFCEKKFARPHEKVKHERIHTGEKPHVCKICGKAFRVTYCLTLHMRTHTGERPYECLHCLKRFKAHSVYKHHLQTHSDERAYKCTYCPKAFKTAVQLAGHKNSHTKPFSCNECSRPFASLNAVRVHEESHRNVNILKFACEMCGYTYARGFALQEHMKNSHGVKEDTSNGEEYSTSGQELETATASIVPKIESTQEVEVEFCN